MLSLTPRHVHVLIVIGSIAVCSRADAQSRPASKEWNDGINRYALVVAVDRYSDAAFPRLPGVEHDGRRIRNTLVRGGFPERNVQFLSSRTTDPSLAPTRRNIENRVNSLLARAGEKDVVVVMLIGHGLSLSDTSYFCPADAPGSARFHPSAAEQSLISIPRLAERMSERKSAQKVLIVDACQDTSFSATHGFQLPAKAPGDVWLLSSCDTGEFAFIGKPDGSGDYHALYSWYLCEGLNGLADSYGDLDGRVSVVEAHKWAMRRTQKAADRIGQVQNPNLLPGLGSLDLVRVSTVLPGGRMRTGDGHLEQQQAAETLAARARPIVYQDHERFNKEVIRQIVERRQIDPALFRDHHNLMCYVFGNYLTPALALDEDCAEAHLVRGYGFRASGEYAAALEEYQAAGIPMEVFASGRIGSIDDFFTRDRQGTPLFRGDLSDAALRQRIESVPLRQSPARDAGMVGSVLASSNLIITDVATKTGADGRREQWLYVSRIDDQSARVPGWIHESSVHWFKEAGQMYIADSRFNSNIPSIVSAQRRASAMASEVGRVQKARQDLRTVNTILGIAGRFGARIPSGVYQGMAIADTVLGYVQAGKMQQHARVYHQYQVAAQNAPRIMAERIRLLRSQQLDALESRPVKIDSSPWRLAVNSPSTPVE